MQKIAPSNRNFLSCPKNRTMVLEKKIRGLKEENITQDPTPTQTLSGPSPSPSGEKFFEKDRDVQAKTPFEK